MSFRLRVVAFAGILVAILSVSSLLFTLVNKPKLSAPAGEINAGSLFLKDEALTATPDRVLNLLPPEETPSDQAGNPILENATDAEEEADREATDETNADSGARKENRSSSSSLINLNSATMKELMKLPGIGEVLAERIIAKRKELGGFKSVEDLLEVKGIGEKKLAKIKPLVVVK